MSKRSSNSFVIVVHHNNKNDQPHPWKPCDQGNYKGAKEGSAQHSVCSVGGFGSYCNERVDVGQFVLDVVVVS